MKWWRRVYVPIIAAGIGMQLEPARAVPPVNTSGRLETSLRLNQPSPGEKSLQWANTVEVVGDSYVWQPWFGVWRGRAAFSRVANDAEQDSTSNLVSGDLDLNLFHRSHFPLLAYASLQESQVDLDATDLAATVTDVQIFRLGATQQYQAPDGSGFYSATLQHEVQNDRTVNARSALNRLQLTGDRRGTVHSFGGVFTLNQTSSSIADSESLFSQATLNHDYRPSDRVSVNSNASLAAGRFSNIFDASTFHSIGLASQGDWRHATLPLRARAEVGFSSQRSSVEATTDRALERYRLRGGLRYDVSPQFSVSADLGLDQVAGDEDALTTFQALAAQYFSLPRDFIGMSYTWNAGVGIANQTVDQGRGGQNYAANLGHAVNRAWTIPAGRFPVVIAFNAGQDLRQERDTLTGELTQVQNRANVSASRSFTGGTAYTQLNLIDLRSFGRTDNTLTSVDFSASYNAMLTRYRTLNASLTLHRSETRSLGEASVNDALTAELLFRDSRLFRVRNLAFESRLRAQSTAISMSERSRSAGDYEWENRLDYRIGLLEVNARTVFTKTRSTQDAVYALTVTRRF